MECLVKCSWLTRGDIPAVIDIEEECFEFPWRMDELVNMLRHRSIIGMVAEVNAEVVGFMVYELHPYHLHLLNFAVRPDLWRKGIGTQMMQKLTHELGCTKRQKIITEVRDANLRAHLFLKACGFWATDVLHDFYDESTEDAYVFEYTKQAARVEPVKVRVAT